MSSVPSLRVLLIEDQPADQDLIQTHLCNVTRACVQVDVAAMLTEGLRLLTRQRYDAVLVNLGLPDSQGPACCARIHSHAPGTPVIVLTSSNDEDRAIESMQQGAQDYLVKDELNPKLIYRSIRYAIERCQAQQRRLLDAERLALITRRLRAVIWSTDAGLRVTSSTGDGLRILADNHHLLIGQPIWNYFQNSASDFPPLAAHHQAIQGEAVSLVFSFRQEVFHIHVEPLHDEDQQIIGTLGIALETTDHQRLIKNMATAQEIHESLFPSSPPALAGFDISGRVYAADETGGDYYDWLELPNGQLGVVVADVSGHGLGAALLMSEFRASLRPLLRTTADLNQVIRFVNATLIADFPEYNFVTAFFITLEPQSCQFSYAGAAHCAYLLRADGEWDQLESTGFPLGLFEDCQVSVSQTLALQKGDLLLIVTDGFQEASRPTDEIFGIERVQRVVRHHRHLPAREIVEQLHQAARNFAAPLNQRDDMTALVIKCLDPDGCGEC